MADCTQLLKLVQPNAWLGDEAKGAEGSRQSREPDDKDVQADHEHRSDAKLEAPLYQLILDVVEPLKARFKARSLHERRLPPTSCAVISSSDT